MCPPFSGTTRRPGFFPRLPFSLGDWRPERGCWEEHAECCTGCAGGVAAAQAHWAGLVPLCKQVPCLGSDPSVQHVRSDIHLQLHQPWRPQALTDI